MKKLLIAGALVASAFAMQQPAQALGGVCSGFVDTGCKQCLDYRYNPPRPTSPSNCSQPNKPSYYEWENCSYYINNVCYVG